jgi:phosphatidylglycerol---prolipoprotein diacylglyceryl transferase
MNIVQFPGLWGLEFQIRRWAFEVFGIRIYWYGIIIAVGFLLAVLLALKDCKKYNLEPDNILDLVLYAAPVAIISARLFYVIFSWGQFKDNPIDIINTRKGGLAIYGGVIGALVVAYIFARVRKMDILKLTDFCMPFVIMAQGIGRWGNFVNQEAFGSQTTLPWRMNGDVPNDYLNSLQQNLDLKVWGVHPTFLYESLWNFAVFFFLLWYRKRKKLDGEVFFLYMILYGFGRFFIESLRTDSLMIGNLRISQVLAALFVIAFAGAFIWRRKKMEKMSDEEPVEMAQSQYGAVLMKLREEEDKSETAGVENKEPQDESPDTSEVDSETEDAEDKKEEE